MSYIYGAPGKDRNFNVVYMDIRLATLKVLYFYLLHNVSPLNFPHNVSKRQLNYKELRATNVTFGFAINLYFKRNCLKV
jgi:hypothetical protein